MMRILRLACWLVSGLYGGMSRLDKVLDDVSEWLTWTRDEGRREVSLTAEHAAWLADVRQGRRSAPAPRRPAAELEGRPEMAKRETAGDRLPASRKPPPNAVPAKPAAATTVASASFTPPPGDTLEKIAAEIAGCTACPLHRRRTKTVPGQGNPQPEILFVGEAPGADEDIQGLAFVGRAGQLLTKMIAAMGFTRDEVFIANINKCRPPDNRAPTTDEMAACLPYLKRQIAILQPKVIVAMGATAINGLVEVPKGVGITKLRGTWMTFEGIDLMPTFHPSYLLRNPPAKKPVWEDLKAVLQRLGRPVPPVKR